jgi:uncharacterized membrane protein
VFEAVLVVVLWILLFWSFIMLPLYGIGWLRRKNRQWEKERKTRDELEHYANSPAIDYYADCFPKNWDKI